MNEIEAIEKIVPYLIKGQIDKLNAGALLFRRYAGIRFGILKVGRDALIIQTVQRKCFTERYLTQKELIARTKDMFSRFFPGMKVHVHAIVYR